MSNEIHCPKCNSTQITANKKGFSGGKAVAGAVLLGGIGLLAGTAGSNKIIITCLKCGFQFKPGEKLQKPPQLSPRAEQVLVGIFRGLLFTMSGMLLLIAISATISGDWGWGLLLGVIATIMWLIAKAGRRRSRN
jgi:hypothetical protein